MSASYLSMPAIALSLFALRTVPVTSSDGAVRVRRTDMFAKAPSARSPIQLWVGGLLVVWGCAAGAPEGPSRPKPPAARPAPPVAASPRAPVAPPEVQTWSALVPLPALLSPKVADVYADWAVHADPRHWYVSREQLPPVGFHALRQRTSTFPGVKHASVWAFRYGGDQLYPNPGVLAGRVPGCGGGIVASDGTFCPSVEYPGRRLSEAQVESLFDIVNTKNDVPRAIMNGFHFDQGFVVLSAAGAPVAELLVDDAATKLYARPRVSTTPIDTLMPARRQRLAELLAEVGLRTRQDEATQEQLERQVGIDQELHPARYVPFASGVDPTLNLGATTGQQQARLCLWQQLVWLRGQPRSGTEGSAIECEDGLKLYMGGYDACLAQFPTCERAVGEVEACMRSQRFDPCFSKPAHRRCRELTACFWGFAEHEPRPH